MPFPVEDPQWLEVRTFLEKYARPTAAILAPNEFLDLFPGNYPYSITYTLPAHHFDFVILHKGMLAEISPAFGAVVMERFWFVFFNEVFGIFAKRPPARLTLLENDDELQIFRSQFISTPSSSSEHSIAPFNRMTVLTCDRPAHLERSLPQILALGVPVVLVDAGSTPENCAINQQIADRYQITLLKVPGDRGKPSAVNMGISYWLADGNAQWISYLTDNVDIHPDLLSVLTQIGHPQERPLLSGRNAIEHADFGKTAIAGYEVRLKRSLPGIHLHAHRDYWTAVLPIPTPKLSERDRSIGRGTEEDWWITAWSPKSVVKQGGYVICVPGLVRTFEDEKEEATWGGIRVPTVTSELSPAIPISVREKVGDRQEEGRSPTTDEANATSPGFTLPANMSLAGTKVLIDGYNLQLTAGTGIKTYSTSLIQGLSHLGARVDVLLSRNASKVNEILDEVLFFDNQVRNGNFILDSIDVVKGLIKNAAGPFYQAKRRKSPTGFVVTQGKYGRDFMRYAQSFNLPQCYDVSNILYRKLNFVSNFSISEKIDIWHVTYPLPIKIRGTKKITTVHDLIPLRLPYATLDDKENFYFKIRDALKESAVTITVSEHSKKDLLEYYDVDPDKIIVTYQPIALEYEELDEWDVEDFLKRYGLDYGKYILFVGAIEPKKNVGRLLDAYATMDTDMPLVIVGKKGWLWEDELAKVSYLFDKESKKKVKLLEYVPVKSLKYLYRGAYFLVFPSLYEGFGLPPLEAMTFGCPVITTQTSSLPEVCRNAALYVDPYDVSDIRQKMETFLSDPYLRDRYAEMGKDNAEFFSMENYLKRLYQAYQKALE
jgi:glycosyltransferase involved in cell wall biosynthesis